MEEWEIITTFESLKWWDMPEEKLKERIALFHKENVSVEEKLRMVE